MNQKQKEQKPRGYAAKIQAEYESIDDTIHSNTQTQSKPRQNKGLQIAKYAATGVLIIGAALAIKKYIEHAHNTEPKMPKVIGAPQGYKIIGFDIPTKGDVKEIYITPELKKSFKGDTLTLEGAIKYTNKSARYEDPTDARGIIKAKQDTRDGTVYFLPK